MESHWNLFKFSIVEVAILSCGQKTAKENFLDMVSPGHPTDQKEKAQTTFSREELLTWTSNIVWWWKTHFEEFLKPTSIHSEEETELENSGEVSPTYLTEVYEVVKKLLSRKASVEPYCMLNPRCFC